MWPLLSGFFSVWASTCLDPMGSDPGWIDAYASLYARRLVLIQWGRTRVDRRLCFAVYALYVSWAVFTGLYIEAYSLCIVYRGFFISMKYCHSNFNIDIITTCFVLVLMLLTIVQQCKWDIIYSVKLKIWWNWWN